MGRVAATEFKARCLELMDRVQARGETFVITKRGKPVARLVPLERAPDETLFGSLAGRAVLTGDVTAPAIAAESWEAGREWDSLSASEEVSAPPTRRRTRRPRAGRK